MFDVIPEKELLLSLHRRLYCLEESENKLRSEERSEIYKLLQERWAEQGEEKRSYLKKFVLEKEAALTKKILADCLDRKIHILCWFDEGYPFVNIFSPPPIVYVKGLLPDHEKNPYIAIVGSRKATAYGREMTEKIVRELCPCQPTIISGLAYGIDAAAHVEALKCGLPTVAVLGSGINSMYPAGNMGLAEKIAAEGAVISEFPWGTPPLKYNFPWRNRLIAGLASATVVVEAEARSGSLITAHWAAEQGKDVFAVPGNVGRVMSKGTNLLVKEGAYLLEDGREILEVLRTKTPCTDQEKKSGQGEDENGINGAIWAFLKGSGGSLDDLVQETGLPVPELLSLITKAEAENF